MSRDLPAMKGDDPAKGDNPNAPTMPVTLLRAQGPDVGGLRSECALSSTRRSLVEWGLVSLLSEHLQGKAKSIGK
jgi:hypothetical protein